MIETSEIVCPADGSTMRGHLARPTGAGPFPGVVVAHDGIGLDDHQRGYADDLARHGYVALAMDYHAGRWFADYDELLAHTLPLLAYPERMREVGRAALDVLLAQPGVDPDRLAGFGLGAGASILLELTHGVADLRAVALIHPGLPEAARPALSATHTAYLLGTGSEDPLCPPDQLLAHARALGSAGVDWRAHVYGGAKHAFWHPPARRDGTLAEASEPDLEGFDHAGWDPRNAQRMWADVVALFAERLR